MCFSIEGAISVVGVDIKQTVPGQTALSPISLHLHLLHHALFFIAIHLSSQHPPFLQRITPRPEANGPKIVEGPQWRWLEGCRDCWAGLHCRGGP